MTGASQDYRDGAARGAQLVAHRARVVARWGLTITPEIVEKLAFNVADIYGGRYTERDEIEAHP